MKILNRPSLVACLMMGAMCTLLIAGDTLPKNKFLADSPWPMTHRHPFNQGSSPFAGPVAAEAANMQSIPGTPVPITLAISSAYPDGRRAIWGNTMKYAFKLDANQPEQLSYLAKIPREQSKDDAISGAYSLLDRDGFYFVPEGLTIEAFRDAVPGDLESKIARTHEFTIASEMAREDEIIVGINMTFDGRIVFVTNFGLVGSLSRELDDLESLRLAAEGEDQCLVSNSLAVDDEGRIIVVTSEFVACLQWEPQDVNRLEESWRVAYESTEIPANGRLGSGSGTTPSLMGWGDQDKLVAICDGRKLMHVVLLWRGDIPDDWPGLAGRDRRIAAEVPVTFGDEQATESTTEQSLLVSHFDLVAVSNKYGELGPLIKRFVRRRMGNDVDNMTVYRSNAPNIAPYGIEKFSWDETANELRPIWARRDLSCPNGIPTMSEETGLMYFMGQRDGHWTMEAIHWSSGEEAFHRTLSNGAGDNSFYAATQIGLDHSIITGTFGGVLRFSAAASDSDVR